MTATQIQPETSTRDPSSGEGSPTHRIGLALSGGGFRAILFHLGLIRFLREANVLPRVSHITSVSGGSILGAHLALNWHRYTGSLEEFDAAAAELIRFVQLDIRNRVVRRYPLAMPLRALRRLTFRRPCRQLTMTGLLEYHYQEYLFGDTCLFQLPQRPQLFILATNLSEGCLCAFTRDGLLMQRRLPGRLFRFDRIHTGLATVPMAVTASSAFPGLFPPIELQGQDVGADPGQFSRLAFTDGGVYDNLGVRMFRCLERSWLAREFRLQKEELTDAEQVGCALQAAAQVSEGTPLRRLAQMMAALPNGAAPRLPSGAGPGDRFVDGLWDVICHENLAREPEFAHLAPSDPEAIPMMHAARCHGGEIEAGEQIWLNRQLVDAAFRQATGKPCFRSLNTCFDAVLVSDSGKQFKISANTRAGGLMATAMRSTDVVMDRVWQLETDTFNGTPGYVFAPIAKVVEPDEDPTALHPEVQRMATDIRTDFDRFSPLEIRSLIQHGYCVGRSACRSRPDLFGTTIPTAAPWNPLASPNPEPVSKERSRPVAAAPGPPGSGLMSVPEPVLETEQSRALHESAQRRIWSTLLDYRDWVSYLYVPILGALLIWLPCELVRSYLRSVRLSHLVHSLSHGSRDLEIMTSLLESPIKPWIGEAAEEVRGLDEPDFKGYEILQDSRIIDMRAWNPALSAKNDSDSLVYGYRRVMIHKRPEAAGNNLFRIGVLATHPKAQLRFPPQDGEPKLRMIGVDSTVPAEKKSRWEVSMDFSKVLAGEFVDLIYEHISPGEFLQRGANSTSITFHVQVDTGEVTRWFLLPQGKEYRSFRILGWETGKPGKVEPVKVVNEYLADDFTILAYKLVSVKAGYTHEVTWFYK